MAGNEAVDKIDLIVNPKMQLPTRIIELTHISQNMVEHGISMEEAFDRFLDFAQEYPLLGHNILFDYSFLKRFAVNRNIVFDRFGIDTLKLSRKLLSELEHKNLKSVCEFLEISVDSYHRAVDDAWASHNIYQILRSRYLQDGILEKDMGLFEPKPLVFKVKKESPITKAQLLYLMNLAKYHKIDVELESLTKNEASRLIDNIKSCSH